MATLKESVEKNPFVYMIGVVLATISATVGVTQYYSSHEAKIGEARCQSQIDDLTTRLASIQRGLSPQTSFLDVRQLMDPQNRPKDSVYFQGGDFYAATPRGWEYALTDERAWFALNAGLTPSEAGVLNSIPKSPLHIWKAKGLGLAVAGSRAHLFPSIIVSRLEYDDIRKLVGGSYDTSVDEAEERAGRSTDETVESYFTNDAAGAFFVQKLSLTATLLHPGEVVTIRDMQRVQNVVYCRYYNARALTVGGKTYSRYYVHTELVLIATQKALYYIETSLPSDEPNPSGPAAAAITTWLTAFRVAAAG